MDAECMKKCPYCAEMIRAEAIKCRYCGSNLGGRSSWSGPSTSPQYWQRVREGKLIAGVCTGIARQFEAPILILPLRLFFLLTTLFYGFGLIMYVILWILMPPPNDQLKTGAGSYSPPPPVSTEPCHPSAREEQMGESALEEPSRGETSPEEPPRENTPSDAPPKGESASRVVPRGESGLRNGMTLLLVFAASLFVLFMLNHQHHLNGIFDNTPFDIPYMEWMKLLIVAGVVLVILAGMGFVAIGVIPLVLVGVGSVLFLRSIHVISPQWIVMALLATAIILIVFSGMRLFRREPKVMSNGV